MLQLSTRAQKLEASATLAMAAKAKELKSKGVDVISFSTGEPDFDTPENIKKACIASLQRGFTKYTPTPGIPELRAAICEKLKRDNNIIYDPSQIVVSCGAKQALYNVFMALLNPGDEVIVPAPYWVSYPEQIKLCDGVPVIVETQEENNFSLQAGEFERAITAKTKMLVLCSPSNPTGAAYTKEDLSAIMDVAIKHNVAVLSDEIYEHLLYDNFTFVSPASLSTAAQEITIVINGVSKAYAMTGWRMGYAAGPKHLIDKVSSLQSQQSSNITSFVQEACVEALNGPQDEVEKMRKTFSKRRDLILSLLRDIPEIECATPQGAFYVFPCIGAYLGKKTESGASIHTSDELAEYLLEEAHIATVSGDAFGAQNYLRLSYACAEEKIVEGVRRLKTALLHLK